MMYLCSVIQKINFHIEMTNYSIPLDFNGLYFIWVEFLSDKERNAILLDIDGKSIDEIAMIMNLKPKRYHYKKTGDKEYRTGFIAQDVELDLNDVGLTNEEFGGLKKKPIMMYNKMVDYGYGLNYDDFVAALVLTVQDLQKQINELKEKRHGT